MANINITKGMDLVVLTIKASTLLWAIFSAMPPRVGNDKD